MSRIFIYYGNKGFRHEATLVRLTPQLIVVKEKGAIVERQFHRSNGFERLPGGGVSTFTKIADEQNNPIPIIMTKNQSPNPNGMGENGKTPKS